MALARGLMSITLEADILLAAEQVEAKLNGAAG